MSLMDNFDWDLIFKSLEGNVSPEERNRIDELIQSNPDIKKEIARLRKIWDTPDTVLPKPDVEQALADVLAKAELHPQRLPFGFPAAFSKFIKIAAVLIIASVITFFLFRQKDNTLFKQTAVKNGARETVVLSDNSKIILDSGTILRFKERFDKNKREVFLNGEGYFEVTPDSERPFIIYADHAVVTVLGTKLNIRSWKGSEKVTAAVLDGTVSFRSAKDKDHGADVILQKNQLSTLEKNKKPSMPETINPEKYLKWLRREMYFANTPLREVLDQVERWHSLDISLSDASPASNRITIFIENKPIEDILELIALVNNFKYVCEGSRIIFSPKE